MSLRQELRLELLTMRESTHGSGMLEQITQFLGEFVECDFRGDLLFYDPVTNTEVTAENYLLWLAEEQIWLVQPVYLPGYEELKAVSVSRRGEVLLELSPLDYPQAEEILRDSGNCKVSFRHQTNAMYARSNGRQIAKISRSHNFILEDGSNDPRCLWVLRTHKHFPRGQCLAARAVDILLSSGFAFESNEEELGQTSAASMREKKLKLELRPDLQLRLQMVQQPHLSMGMNIGVGQKLELQALFAVQYSLLRLKGDDLVNYVASLAEKYGEEHTLRALDFALARVVKDTQPHLTWPQARAEVRRLASRV